MKMKKILIWALAVIITLSAAVYQRVTGPTYPKSVKISIDSKINKFKLLRSHESTSDATIKLKIEGDVQATLFYKLYPSKAGEEWKQVNFERAGAELLANLPKQPAAGKLMYYINIKTQSASYDIEKDKPVVIRFKGDVPAYILIPHIFFIFFAMLFANAAGLFASFKMSQYKRLSYITLALIAIGGMILGPIVQKFAFGELWTGIPFGFDLTDNKTLIAFIFWIVAVLGQLKKQRPYLTIIAALVTLIIFSIPHSMFGSELDRASGAVTQGFIQLFGIW
jgi:hypothetical protein